MYLQWLNEERLIQRLTELMHTGRDEEVQNIPHSVELFNPSPHDFSYGSLKKDILVVLQRQSNACQTLCDIIRLSRDQGNQLSEVTEPDPLLAVLES